MEWVPSDRTEFEIAQKSAQSSESVRIAANSLFKNKAEHSRREHKDILNLYSKSIAYAPNDSEELACGYGNRSFFLIHLKMYELAVTDIDRALKITKSNVLKAKLLCRKITAIKSIQRKVPQSIIDETKKAIKIVDIDDKQAKLQLDDIFQKAISQKIDINFFRYKPASLPKINANKDMSATSTAIRMDHNKHFGRHYRATRNISAGELLIIEQAYAVAPKIEHLYVLCSFCLNITWNGVPCDNCPCVFYCSEECKEAAWESYHDLECPILVLVFEKICNAYSTILTLRVLLKGFKRDCKGNFDSLLKEFLLANNAKDERTKGFKNNIFSSNNIRSIFSLECHFFQEYKSSPPPSLHTLLAVLTDKFQKLFYSSEFSPSLQDFGIENFGNFVMNTLCLMKTNSYMVQILSNCMCVHGHEEDCFNKSGSIIGACTSLINHSCVPNAAATFKDGKIILYAIRPITKNEQIFDSYGPNCLQPYLSRQDTLLTNYKFKCNCIGCEKRWYVPPAEISDVEWASSFDFELISKLSLVFDRTPENWSLLCKMRFKKLVTQFISELNEIYHSNSLLKVISLGPMFKDLLPWVYEAYYGINPHLPADYDEVSRY